MVFYMLFAEAMDYFFDYCEMKELRPKTLIHYSQSVKLFVKWAQEQEQITEVDEVSELTIRKYIRFLQTRGKYTECINVTQSEYNHPENRKDYHVKVSNVTINNYFRSIRAFFNWLESEQIIEKTPFQKIRELPAQRKPKEYFTDTEVRSILAKFDKREFSEYRDMMAMILMLDSGMRLGETLSMEVEQIDLVNRSIILPAEKTKGRKEREVYFSSRTGNELRRWLQFKAQHCDITSLVVKCSVSAIVKASSLSSADIKI